MQLNSLTNKNLLNCASDYENQIQALKEQLALSNEKAVTSLAQSLLDVTESFLKGATPDQKDLFSRKFKIILGEICQKTQKMGEIHFGENVKSILNAEIQVSTEFCGLSIQEPISPINWKPISAIPLILHFQMSPQNTTIEIFNKLYKNLKDLSTRMEKDLFQGTKKYEFKYYLYDDPANEMDDLITDFNRNLSHSFLLEMNASFGPMLPPQTAALNATYLFLQKHCKDRPLVQYSEKELLNLMLEINGRVSQIIELDMETKKVTKHDQPARFREKGMVVFDYSKVPGWDDPDRLVGMKAMDKGIERHLRPKYENLWELYKKKTRAKVWNQHYAAPEKKKKDIYYDDEDDSVLSHIAYIAPHSLEVPHLLNAFVKELLKQLKTGTDAYEIAAYCHHKIGEIHPFNDKNGCTARIMMNLILLQAGKPPLIFDNDINYTAAVRKNDPKIFAAYLKDLVKKQPVMNTFMLNAMKEYFKRLCIGFGDEYS